MNISKRQLRIKKKLANNFGYLWFKNEKFLIVDCDPTSDKQKEQIYLEIQTRIDKDAHKYSIDYSIEDGKLFCFINIDGTQEKVHTSWLNKKIRVLRNIKNFRISTNSNTLYRREVIDFRFKKGQLISEREFLQEFPYVPTGRHGRSRPLKPYIRE